MQSTESRSVINLIDQLHYFAQSLHPEESDFRAVHIVDCSCPQEALGLRVKQMQFFDKLTSTMKNKRGRHADSDANADAGPDDDSAQRPQRPGVPCLCLRLRRLRVCTSVLPL